METKKEFKYFTIFNHKKEEEYLREMHKKGWRFIKVSGFGMYHFEKCEPEDIIYQLDYNAEKDGREEYIKMYEHLGWQYIQDYAGYSYFKKPVSEMNGEEEIFSDDESKNAMKEKVYKARFTPLLVLFLAVLIPQFIIQLSLANYTVAMFFGVVLVIYIICFIFIGIDILKSKR